MSPRSQHAMPLGGYRIVILPATLVIFICMLSIGGIKTSLPKTSSGTVECKILFFFEDIYNEFQEMYFESWLIIPKKNPNTLDSGHCSWVYFVLFEISRYYQEYIWLRRPFLFLLLSEETRICIFRIFHLLFTHCPHPPLLGPLALVAIVQSSGSCVSSFLLSWNTSSGSRTLWTIGLPAPPEAPPTWGRRWRRELCCPVFFLLQLFVTHWSSFRGTPANADLSLVESCSLRWPDLRSRFLDQNLYLDFMTHSLMNQPDKVFSSVDFPIVELSLDRKTLNLLNAKCWLCVSCVSSFAVCCFSK